MSPASLNGRSSWASLGVLLGAVPAVCVLVFVSLFLATVATADDSDFSVYFYAPGVAAAVLTGILSGGDPTRSSAARVGMCVASAVIALSLEIFVLLGLLGVGIGW